VDFKKLNATTKKDPFPLPIYKWGTKLNGEVWSIFIFGWIFWVSSYLQSSKG
jgi:hypothetical protein